MLRNSGLLRRVWAHDKTIDSIKVALALLGVIGVSLWFDRQHWVISLILGVIASALAETEDRVSGRLKSLFLLLICFAVASFSVKLLFPYPWLFVIGLMTSTFAFVMLGAAGERYATIALGSLILAVYTMLVADHAAVEGEATWWQPVLLLSGAIWYGLLSLLAAALFRTRASRQSLAHVFNALSTYLALKAALLEPVSGRDENAQRLALADQNGRLVDALNKAREVLIRWVQDSRPSPDGTRHLKWYFLAQDVHERASSAHYPYRALTDAFARSDILFRAQRLMRVQASACARLADAILRGIPFDYGRDGVLALDELSAALQYVQDHPAPEWSRLVDSLADLCRNITTIERLLANAGNPDSLRTEEDSSLRDGSPQTLGEMWRRIRVNLTPESSRFRHGLRLSLALAAGYGLLHLFKLPQGYWVMLTTLFVCQPSYSGTWRRMGQRIGGTVLGLLAASLFILTFPQVPAQLALIVVAGVAFFALRADRYLLATACITVLVLICFNQVGSGYALIWPRLLDTVIGALLASVVVACVLPDWQGRHLHQAMASTIQNSGSYLASILGQYRQGKHDDLPYRVARRDAHNADAELSRTLSSMLGEPDKYQLAPDLAFRFLCVSHTLLGYISALGAHREQVAQWQHGTLIENVAGVIADALKGMAESLAARQPRATFALDANLAQQLDDVPTGASAAERRVVRQLALIYRMLPEVSELSAGFATADIKQA
ncbi:YccS family putative transporter [Uliginosibacterium sp. H3]|uniref:YccS family putative transporter n=1 Tax=Uliginosibacterium silvisoli TaxID=3114758 RepID=A0ABU6K6M7_9RHOO|nr:YccS family putative transporter [Uliginosibacterium sp. H3]